VLPALDPDFSLRDLLISSVDKLEHPCAASVPALQRLYLLTMGKYPGAGSLPEKRRTACRELNQVASIGFLCHNLNERLNLLPTQQSLELEQELRMLLNILITVVLQVGDDPQVVRDLMDSGNGVEEMCFRSIKYSLEIAVVPIRKFLVLFYLYLRLQFGPAPKGKHASIILLRDEA